jgi:hypothetical protein
MRTGDKLGGPDEAERQAAREARLKIAHEREGTAQFTVTDWLCIAEQALGYVEGKAIAEEIAELVREFERSAVLGMFDGVRMTGEQVRAKLWEFVPQEPIERNAGSKVLTLTLAGQADLKVRDHPEPGVAIVQISLPVRLAFVHPDEQESSDDGGPSDSLHRSRD